MQTDIPKDQLERVQPVVDGVIADLRARAGGLTGENSSALIYVVDAEETSEPRAHR